MRFHCALLWVINKVQYIVISNFTILENIPYRLYLYKQCYTVNNSKAKNMSICYLMKSTYFSWKIEVNV